MSVHPSLAKLYSPQDIMHGPYPARTASFTQAGYEASRHGMTPAAEDDGKNKKRIAVILVDYQHDFVDPTGTLAVDGAREDVQRFLQWFYTNAAKITTIYASLDTHLPQHIFFSNWWRHGKTGLPPKPFTEITVEQVEQGEWIPQRDPQWSRQYVQTLRESNKRVLMIWPYHTMEGTLGHMLVSPISEAIAWHSAARETQPTFVPKGRTMRTEYYGLFGAEVIDPEDEQSELNVTLLDAVMRHDEIYIAGEAKSHCVLESEKQIINRFAGQPRLMKRLNFLIDCTKSITDPTGARDFDKEANAWLKKFKEENGIQLVNSTDALK